MSFHLAIFSASIASATANRQLAALGDPIMAPAGNGLLVNPLVSKILRVIAQGNLLIRAGLTAGSIRDLINQFDISPVNVGTAIETPLRMVDLIGNPFPLEGDEELDAFVSNSGAGATVTSVGVILGDRVPIKPPGTMFSVHFTTTQALVAGAFQSFTPVLDNGLGSGTFALVGSRLRSTTGLFHRYIPRGGTPFRPGGPMYQAADDGFPEAKFRYGEMGEWLRFTNTTPPQIEAFALAADAAASVDGYMDLIQVA